MRPRSSELLKSAKLPALLVTNLTNIRYLTGAFISAGLLLVLPRRYALFVDDRYREEVASHIFPGISIYPIDRFLKVIGELKTCGFEAEDVTVARRTKWARTMRDVKFMQTVDVVEEFRRAKSEEEVRILKRADRITMEILRRVPTMLRKSISEEELARQLLRWALELGAEGLSFDPIVAFGTHTSCPHHRPTSRRLKKGHIVQIDVGAKVRGYCADASEVFFTAKPTDQQLRMYHLLKEVQQEVVDAIHVGTKTRSLDGLARSRLGEAGVDKFFSHSLGHGVGLDIHEGVNISSKAPDKPLLKNEVVTVEPGVYFPGKFGMRVERIVVVL